MAVDALLFLLLLAFSAFFSASETAFFSLSKLQVKRQKEEGGPTGRRVAELLSRPQRLLVTILVGNTVVNTGAASLAERWRLRSSCKNISVKAHSPTKRYTTRRRPKTNPCVNNAATTTCSRLNCA